MYDELENKLYEKWKKEGNIGKEGYPTLNEDFKLSSIVFSLRQTKKSGCSHNHFGFGHACCFSTLASKSS